MMMMTRNYESTAMKTRMQDDDIEIPTILKAQQYDCTTMIVFSPP